jgi:hypothetical protein
MEANQGTFANQDFDSISIAVDLDRLFGVVGELSAEWMIPAPSKRTDPEYKCQKTLTLLERRVKTFETFPHGREFGGLNLPAINHFPRTQF